MGKMKKALGIRAVRLGVMAAFVATFFGAPSVGYMTGNETLQKLDAVEIVANLVNAPEVVDPFELGIKKPLKDTLNTVAVTPEADTNNIFIQP